MVTKVYNVTYEMTEGGFCITTSLIEKFCFAQNLLLSKHFEFGSVLQNGNIQRDDTISMPTDGE